MTIAASTRRNDYTGNGAANTYAYGWKIFDDDDLQVIVADTDGAETILTKTTDYTVTGVGGASGGNIVLVNAGQAWLTGGYLKTNYHLTVLGGRAYEQDTSIRNQGPFYPNVAEDAWDKLTVLVQQLRERVNRAITLKKTSTESGVEFTGVVSGNAGEVIVVNADADGIEPSGTTITQIATYASQAAASATAAATSASNASASASSASSSATAAAASASAAASSATSAAASAAAAAAAVGTDTSEEISGTYNGANTSFTLSQTPKTGSLRLFLNGIFQMPGVGKDYTLSGTTITMGTAPQSDQILQASYRY